MRSVILTIWTLQVIAAVIAVIVHVNGVRFAQSALGELKATGEDGILQLMARRLRRGSIIRIGVKALLAVFGMVAIIGVSMLAADVTLADPRVLRGLTSSISALIITGLLSLEAYLDYRDRSEVGRRLTTEEHKK